MNLRELNFNFKFHETKSLMKAAEIAFKIETYPEEVLSITKGVWNKNETSIKRTKVRIQSFASHYVKHYH